MITPLSNTLLFDDQPLLVYLLHIVNNTGKTFNIKTKTVIASIEHLHRTDLVEPSLYI